MRRPPPLPTRPSSGGERKTRTQAPPGGAAPDPRAGSDAQDDVRGEMRPPSPLPIPGGLVGGPDGDRATSRSAADSSARDAGPLRMRDVWRAAGARRRVLRAEMRRFTARQRRRRTIWLSVAAAVVLLVVGSVGAAYSPLFAVRDIRVVGAVALPAADVEQSLSGQLGTPLPLVDASAVKAALVAFPLVESYTLEARPPGELVVRIVERTPVGVVSSEAGWSVVDAAGVVLSTAADPPAGLPVLEIDGGAGSPAFTAAGRVVRALPDDIRGQVTAVRASTRDDVTLTLNGATDVLWGGVSRTSEKVLLLEAAMAQRPPDTVSVYDVSSPDALVVR